MSITMELPLVVSQHVIPGLEYNSTYRKRATYTSTEWDLIKPVFLDLYLRQGLILKDVMAVLGSEYGFHASTKMYKSAITRWKVHKYQKPHGQPAKDRQQKQSRSKRSRQSCDEVSPVRKLPCSPTARNMTDEFDDQESLPCNDQSRETLCHTPLPMTDKESYVSKDMPLTLPALPSHRAFERALYSIRKLVESDSAFGSNVSTLSSGIESVRPITEEISNTALYLRQGEHEQGLQSYDRLVMTLSGVLHVCDTRSLWLICSLFCKIDSPWLGPTVRSSIKYLAAAKGSAYLQDHPLSTITQATLSCVSGKDDMMRTIILLVRRILRDNGAELAITDWDLFYTVYLQRANKYVESLREMIRLYEICLLNPELSRRFSGRLLYQMGWTLSYLRHDHLARGFLEMARQRLTDLFGSHSWAYNECCFALVRCHVRMGNFEEAHALATETLVGGNDTFHQDLMWTEAIQYLMMEIDEYRQAAEPGGADAETAALTQSEISVSTASDASLSASAVDDEMLADLALHLSRGVGRMSVYKQLLAAETDAGLSMQDVPEKEFEKDPCFHLRSGTTGCYQQYMMAKLRNTRKSSSSSNS